jgi:predicted methyltransferase
MVPRYLEHEGQTENEPGHADLLCRRGAIGYFAARQGRVCKRCAMPSAGIQEIAMNALVRGAARTLLPSVLGTAIVACAALTGADASAPKPDAAIAARLDQILAGDQRSDQDRARDVFRHPKETLLFFGVRPDMTIVEIFPGEGWYTEILAPLVRGSGKYYAAHYDPDSQSKYQQDSLRRFREKLAARPDLYGEVHITALGPTRTEIAPRGSADLVVTFRNIHNWMAGDYAPTAFRAMYDALKPGGVLGVEEHRGRADQPQDPRARSGYVREDYAIALIERVGFKLVARSEINANPRDTKDYELGVWALPPTYRAGEKDRQKFAAIGESDHFTLKFVKPAK